MVMEGAAGRSARSAVVVGGGVGGLSTAIRLKLSGQFDRVRILEKNDRLGGRVKTLKLQSSTSSSSVFRFDTGPSLLLFPEEYMRTFEELGCELPEMKPVGSVGYRCFFNRGGPRRPGQPPDTLDLLLEDDEMVAQLESVEEGAGEAYSRMIRAARTALEVGTGAFIDRNFATLAEFVNPLRFLPLLPRLVDGGILNPLSLLRPLDGWLRGYFRDPRIRALTLYVGLSPYTAPSAFSLLAATELTDGVYYPAGGFGEVALALEARAKQVGVEVELAAEVEAVTTSSRGWVSGVRTKGGRGHDASVVVVNADLPWAQRNIAGLGEKGKTEVRGGGPDDSRGYSAGIVEFCWGVRGDDLQALQQHNVFLSSKSSKSFEESWTRPGSKGGDLPEDANFYIHVPSKTDPTAVSGPGPLHSVMVLFPVANKAELQAGVEYADLVEWSRDLILRRLKEVGVDLEGKIEVEAVTDPDAWESEYNLQNGAAFGLAHGLDQLGWFRPRNKDESRCGVYYVGASTHPGNGVPLVFKSARLVCERILEDLGPSANEM